MAILQIYRGEIVHFIRTLDQRSFPKIRSISITLSNLYIYMCFKFQENPCRIRASASNNNKLIDTK